MKSDNPVVGFLYTTTNGEHNNDVVRLSRHANGELSSESVYDCHSRGGSSHASPANGDYDAQGAVALIGDYLLTTNTGGHTVSVFVLTRDTGVLEHLHNVGSGGLRPVTLHSTPVAGSESEHWVVVGNQWGTPTVLYDGDKLRRYPNDEFFKQDLTQPDASDRDRSVYLFRLDTRDGSLTAVGELARYVRENGGPCDVKFSPDGTKLCVTVWGICHFLTHKPLAEEIRLSRVYVYDFADGQVSNGRHWEEAGVTGAVGFHWSPNSEVLYVSHFNLLEEKHDHGLVVLADRDGVLSKLGHFNTGEPNEIDEACWTVLSPNADRLYVGSFETNVITPYRLDEEGKVAETLPFARRAEGTPLEDTKDLWVDPSNEFLYALGSFVTYSIARFRVTVEGLELVDETPLQVTKDAIGKPGVYDLAGLVGYSR
jgi:6-phosphogluconolactonase (cycloisomerase 2 family)